MDNKTKIVLSAVGVSAVLIPLGLLMFLTSRPAPPANLPTGSRQIDADSVNKVVQSNQTKVVYTSPSPSTASAKPVSEGTNSAN